VSLSACLVGWVGQGAAQDTDGDGLSDFEEVSRVRTAQFGPQHRIDTSSNHVFAADLDGDGDPDVLSAYSSTRTWYENRLDEASADFGPPQIISTAASWVYAIFAVDLDGDGDPDMLSAGVNSPAVEWFENRLDEASADFGPRRVIGFLGTRSVFAADLDGDGDPEVISAGGGASFFWSENRLDEASADFGPQQQIATDGFTAETVFAADLDGDGDSDVLLATGHGDTVVWYENRHAGPNRFGPPRVITTAALKATSAIASDLDGDGDLDVISTFGICCDSAGLVAWYENRLGEASADFGPQQVITAAVRFPLTPFTADLDGDGDPDVLSASGADSELYWHENRLDEASADFGPQRVILAATGGRRAVASDLDGDGDLDVLQTNSVLAWYENPGTDPQNPDSDDDGLQDADELNVHGTDPNDPDSDDDGYSDEAELRRGSDPNDSNSNPPPFRGSMLYKGTLSLYGVRHRERFNAGSYYWRTYSLVRPQGAPLSGSGIANNTLHVSGSPFSFTLPGGGLEIKTPSLSGGWRSSVGYYTYADLQTHPNTSFANDSGFFGPGGGPGSHSFGHYQTTTMSGGSSNPRWNIIPGANQFGGTMRLLGAIDETRNLRIWHPGVNFYAHAPDPFSALGGRCAVATGCPSLPVSQASRIVQYYTPLKGSYTTALVKTWGYAWTTGRVSVTAYHDWHPDTKIYRSGYDHRTSLGQGFMQLVSPHMAYWDFASRPLDRATGSIAILKLEFVPEPGALLMLAAGASVLAFLYRVGRRG